jgi:hypothetical protein
MMREVRLMNEYTFSWPLWGDVGPAERDDFKLSPDLRAGLETWAKTFNDHFDWQSGWDDHSLVEDHAAAARELRDRLACELGPAYRVKLHLWEC